MLGAVLVLLLLGAAGPASAHAALRSGDPADGAVLKAAPRTVTLTFTESVGLLDDSFRLFGPDGRRVRTGEPRHAPGRPDTAQVAFPAGSGEGTFTVAWRVVSADSHPVSGAFTFSVGHPSLAPAAIDTGPAEDPLTGSLYDLARYTAYGAAALLIGTAAFVLLCRPPDAGALRGPLATGWWLLLAATLALLVLRAPYESGAGPSSALTPSALSRTLTGRPGAVLLTRVALLAPTALFLGRLLRRGPGGETRFFGRGPEGEARFFGRGPKGEARLLGRGPEPDAPGQGRTAVRTAPAPATPAPAAAVPARVTLATGAVLAVALALTWAAAEHASAGLQVPAAMTSSVLHLLAMAVWLGGLAALLTTLRRTTPATSPTPADPATTAVAVGSAVGPAATAATAARFSRLAFLAVTVLVVTGVYQSWRGLGSWS
ncbi:copper resistance protein CopC/CopD, partial [Streptomyces sp. SID10815]|nr:copper resistance protein CopC/CopD [Streptomyces sp. SID10815]